MATIGRGIYAETVHRFFEGIRTYDVDAAVAELADDADLFSPWGNATGKDAIADVLRPVLEDPKTRPSFTIQDIAGDGHVVKLQVSISGRFGRAAKVHEFKLLHLKGIIHQVIIA